MPAYELRPFRLQVPDAVLEDLRARLARTRLPEVPPLEPWSTGTDVAYLKGLLDYWRDGFDWRAQETLLNGFRQFSVPLAGIDLHFIHEEGRGPKPMPLLLSHGWPGSVLEFHKLLPMLTDPARFGGDPSDAFTVVAPSLPGYVFSFKPGQQRFGLDEIAAVFASLMHDVLGYERFGAQGGDWGAFVTTRLGYAFAERMIGIHLNLLAVRRDPKMLANPTAEEKLYLEQLAQFLKEETGYQWIQGTKPTTLAFALTDSPAGLAAWLVEKFRSWTDCDGNPENALTRDEMLADIMLYWVTGAIGSQARAVAGAAGQDCRRADGLRRISQGDPAPAALGGRAHVWRYPALDGDEKGRALCRARAAGSTGQRDPRILPPVAPGLSAAGRGPRHGESAGAYPSPQPDRSALHAARARPVWHAGVLRQRWTDCLRDERPLPRASRSSAAFAAAHQ